MKKILYNPVQVAFMDARRKRKANGDRAYRRLALIAGRRGGKTMISALAAAEEASIPFTTGAMFAPTYPMIHDIVIPAFREFWPEEWCYGGSWDKGFSESHLTLRTSVNSTVHFRSLDNPDRARGLGLHWASIDEACMLPKYAWQVTEACLTEHKGVAWIATSPKGFDWVYESFWQRAIDGEEGYWAARYKTSDNPIIDSKEVERNRKGMDPLMFRQEYEADFVNFTGAIYGDLVDSHVIHVADSDKVLHQAFPEWPDVDPRRSAVIGLDPGADHPFAASLLLASDIGWVLAGEYRERNKPLVDHIASIRSLSTKFGGRETRYVMDRSAKQVQIEFGQYGIYPSSSESHVESGIMRVQSWFRDDKLWILDRHCPSTIEELRSYRWDETTTKDGQVGKAKPFKVKDDLCDALRYGVMSCFDPEPITVEKSGKRQLKDVPHEAQWAWSREQRLGKDQEEDNWLPDTAEDYPMGQFFE